MSTDVAPVPRARQRQFLGLLLERLRPTLRKDAHHEYSQMTPWVLHGINLVIVVTAVTALGAALATGAAHVERPAAALLLAVLACVAATLPIRLHTDAWITFNELFLVLTFVLLPIGDAAVVALVVCGWMALHASSSWFGALGDASGMVVEAALGLGAAVATGHVVAALGASDAVVVVAQVLVATIAMNLGILVTDIPYRLFVDPETRSVLSPFTLRDVADGTTTMLAAQAPTAMVVVFAAREAPWLAALALAPLLHSWWTVERSIEFDEATRRATTDALTGMLNRYGLHDQLAPRLQQAGTEAAFVLGDIDGFKQINDTLGHAEGDRVLRTVGRVIAKAARSADCIAARYGGEEFVIVHFDTDLDHVVEWTERVRSEIREELLEIGSSISLGIGRWHGPLDDVDEAIHRADAAMYAAKSAGKNRTFVDAGLDAPRPVVTPHAPVDAAERRAA